MRRFFTWFKWLILYPLLGLIILLTLIFITVSLFTTPSHNRDWNIDQAILPYAEINDNLVTIHNVRNFSYESTTSYTPGYYDKTYDLNKIKKVWYMLEPFSGIPGSAHTLLSFEFEDDMFVAISAEIRKEKGEGFSPIKGLFNKFELMYVVADEKDVIKLRSNYRKDDVYVYPAKTTKARELFVDMIERVNEIKDKPEFYNTIINNCTTNLVRHVNTIAPGRAPMLTINVVLPAHSDELAYRLGLFDTILSFEEAREHYHINERALKYANSPDFSVKIREEN